MICLLHSIRDRAKKEKSPRSVGASGVKCFVLNDFEQKLLEKNSTAGFIQKNRKNFPLLISLKKIEKIVHCWFHWKKIEKFPLLISFKKKFVTFYRIFQEVKKSVKFSVNLGLNFSHPYKIFCIMVGETLKKLSKSYRI